LGKLYTVEELKNSGLLEGFSVNIRLEGDLCQMMNLKISKDYEGPGNGIYINGLALLNDIDSKKVIKVCFLLKERNNVIVSGEIRYCGGGKIDEYVCGLRNVFYKKSYLDYN